MISILVGCLSGALLICVIFVYIQVREAHQNNELLFKEIEQLKTQIFTLTRYNRVRAKSEPR